MHVACLYHELKTWDFFWPHQDNPSEKDINQGSLLVFNLDSSVSNDQLREIFGVYGAIKEVNSKPTYDLYFTIEWNL